MNRLFSTEGIVLKSIKLNEADKIVTVFSNEYGKIRGIAKGVRKTKSQFGSSLESLSITKLLIYKGGSINIINQTEIINSFFSQTRNLFQYGLAIKCAEIVDRLSVEEDPNRELYDLFKKLLLLLKDEQNPILLVESFMWKLFSILGYKPELRKCVHCNNIPCKEKSVIFDISKGGISCIKCNSKTSFYRIEIALFYLKILQRMLIADLEVIHNKKIDQSILSELTKITEIYLSYHFEIDNKSRHFLNRLKSLQ